MVIVIAVFCSFHDCCYSIMRFWVDVIVIIDLIKLCFVCWCLIVILGLIDMGCYIFCCAVYSLCLGFVRLGCSFCCFWYYNWLLSDRLWRGGCLPCRLVLCKRFVFILCCRVSLVT